MGEVGCDAFADRPDDARSLKNGLHNVAKKKFSVPGWNVILIQGRSYVSGVGAVAPPPSHGTFQGADK